MASRLFAQPFVQAQIKEKCRGCWMTGDAKNHVAASEYRCCLASIDSKFSKSHYKDKTLSWQSSVHNGNPIPGKTVFILRRGTSISIYAIGIFCRWYHRLSIMMYRKLSNIRRTKQQNLYVSHLVLQLSLCVQFIEARCSVGNEDVVGAAPTGDVPATSEWPTIVLASNVWLILDVLR